MDDQPRDPDTSSGSVFRGVAIKKEPFTVSVDTSRILLAPESGAGQDREFKGSVIFDAVPETDGEGLPALALAIRTPGGIKRIVLSFPEWAGGASGRDRLEAQVQQVTRDALPSGSAPGPGDETITIPGILIKGTGFALGISSQEVTLTPENPAEKKRIFPRDSVVDATAETGETGIPQLMLGITTPGGRRQLLLAFPEHAGGARARDRAVGLITAPVNKKTPAASTTPSPKPLLLPGIAIKGHSFNAELLPDRIRLSPENGDGRTREFVRDAIFDVTAEFTSEGIHSAALAINTPGGIQTMILSFSEDAGGAGGRDQFISYVHAIINRRPFESDFRAPSPKKQQPRMEYPICQRSCLMLEEEQVGLLLTSKRLIIYEGDADSVAVIEEFPARCILDASPTLDLEGRPAMVVSFLSEEKEIIERRIVFEDPAERDSWISLLTADELPPPLIDNTADEALSLPDQGQDMPLEEHEEEDETAVDGFGREEEPPGEAYVQPAERCPACRTLTLPESPWCDICGIRLSADRDWRGLDEYVLMLPEETVALPPDPKREPGRLKTFLFTPSAAERFRDDPIRLPLLFFLTSILVCILGNIAVIGFFSTYTSFDESLYPIISALITDPVIMATFTATALFAALLSATIAATLGYLIVGREEGSFRKVLGITFYSSLPFGIIGIVPLLGILTAPLWSVLILSGALRSAFDFSVPASFFPPVASNIALFVALLLITGGFL
ncbi:MAG: YIP1 family protein [Methanocalculus sp. MSAO_Arc1]|uniref:Yip1 family protein n=1 Tax=Methanocalculus TaxID=71151 RepID=UPI000FEFE442|nr:MULTISPECIES: Yip1 family protein [unclassified Methanocalculus]MCP1662932.1 hypothetical protein [Methanocalculus sp. AMF5]RQD79451.1 MAG: YIP1 family protein [Methanocalculus sp. MSAO_Arc1]